MRPRFAANLIVLTGGAMLATAAFAFATVVISWITVGVATAVALAALAEIASAEVASWARWVALALAVIAGWTIVAARVFDTPAEIQWSAFAAGAAFAGFGWACVIFHELSLERRLVQLERAAPGRALARRDVAEVERDVRCNGVERDGHRVAAFDPAHRSPA